MSGRVCYIAGGTGIVGSGIARSLLESGFKVWISSRNETSLNDFKNSLSTDLQSRLGCIKGEISNEIECAKVRDQILSVDKTVHHVISSIGGWWQKGVLSDQPLDEFNSLIASHVVPHLVVYKIFAKILQSNPGSTYTFITGGSGEMFEQGHVFLKDASLVPVFGNAVYGLYDAAYAEFHQHPNLKVSQLRIFTWVRTIPDSNFNPQTSQLEVGTDFVGRFIPKIIEKHRDGIFKIKSRQEANVEYDSI